MTIRNDHRGGRATLGPVLDEIGPWEARRRVWHQYLGTQPRGAGLTDPEGVYWRLVLPDTADDVFMYRVWSSEHGQSLLEPDLAGVLAAQDLQARRAGALLRAFDHAAEAIRWTALGLWRTPAVRLVLLLLAGAAAGALVTTIGLSVAP